jgi:hypothetical protein
MPKKNQKDLCCLLTFLRFKRRDQMRKRNLIKTLLFITIFSVLSHVLTPYIGFAQNHDQQIKVIINGELQVYDQSPVIKNGRTLVPLRGIFETLDTQVNWDGSTKTVTAVKENKHVKIQIGSNIASINGKQNEIDVPAQILNGRTMVPLRFISETLGAQVQWDGATRTIFIESVSKPDVTSSNEIPPFTPRVDAENTVKLMENVNVFNQKTIEKVNSISSDGSTIVFNSEATEIVSLEPEDLFTLPEMDNYPLGLAKKVVSVTSVGDKTVVETVDPEFEELIDTIDISTQTLITENHLIPLEGVTIEQVSKANTLSTSSNTTSKKDTIIIKVNKDISLDQNQVAKINGELVLDRPEVITDMYYKNKKVEGARFEFETNQTGKVNVSGGVFVKNEVRVPVAKIFIPVKRPFGVLAKLDLVLKVDGSAELTVTYTQNTEMDVGFVISKDTLDPTKVKISPIAEMTNKSTFDPLRITGKVTETLSVDPNIYISVHQLEIAGIENSLGIRLNLGGQLDFTNGGCFQADMELFAESKAKISLLTYSELVLHSWKDPLGGINDCKTSTTMADSNKNLDPELIWSKDFIGKVNEPAVGLDGTIYITQTGGTLVALNPDGEQKWEFKGTGLGPTGQPVITSDGSILVGGYKKLYALNPDGSLEWTKEFDGTLGELTLGADGILYVGSSSVFSEEGIIYTIDSEGTILWKTKITTGGVGKPIISSDGTIYIIGGGKLIAVNRKGEKIWEWGEHISGHPAIDHNGMIYVISRAGYLVYSVNSSGKKIWEYPVGYLLEGSSPVIAPDGTIYVNGSGKLYGFTSDGKLKTEYTVGDHTSKPVITADGTIYITSWALGDTSGYTSLLAVWNPNGKVDWDFRYTKSRFEGITVLGPNGMIYIGGGSLFAISAPYSPNS